MKILQSGADWRTGFLLGMCIGSAFGAALSLLYAPLSGKELRHTVREKASSLFAATGGLIEKTKTRTTASLQNATKTLRDQQARVTGAVNAGIDTFREGATAEQH